MKRTLSQVVMLFIWACPSTLFAQEPIENELELVRQLRAKGKGWNDLVRTKIDELLKRNDPILNAALPLELARVNIDAARQLDPEQRFALFTAARGQLDDYIKKNQGKVGAALASVELARLTSYHAQALLSKAMREEDNQSRHLAARPAEKMFIQAGADLEAAVKSLESAVKDPKNSAMKKTLEHELQQARFDTATNYFDQARTYIDKGKDVVNQQRSLTIDKAKKLFLELSRDESAEVGYLANAWYMKCSIEHNDPPNAQKYYSYLMKKKDDPAAKAAVRLATFFYIQDITLPRTDDVETIGSHIVVPKNPKDKKPFTPTDQLHKVEKECEAWLKTYGVKKSYDGEGVLFELAYAYLVEASILEKSIKDAKDKKLTAKDDKIKTGLFKKAEEKFDELAKLDGDNAERARQISASIKRMTLPATGKLTTFGDYLMRAMLERDKVRELSNKLEDAKNPEAAKKIEDERKKKLKDVINALNEGLNLTTLSDSPSKVDDARYYLCGAYLTYGDPYRAAIIAESLGRHRPATKRSPEGAATAIATYASLQSRSPDDAVLRARLQDMATFVLAPENKVWSADPVASLAHYHLAMLDKKDNKLKSAVQHLEKIAPGFTDYIYTQGQLVFIAEDARLNTADPKEQKWYTTAAKAAIGRMPKFNLKEDSPSVITMYFFAKIEMSKFLYSEAYDEMKLADGEGRAVLKCNEMAKYLKGLQAEFESVSPGKISGKSHDQIDFTLRVMLKYADLGIAEAKFRGTEKDRFDQVLKATNTVVTDMLAEAKKAPAGDIVKKDNAVIGKILGLALRASVQKGDVTKGKAILDVLQRLKGEGGNDAGTGNIVSELLRDIAIQIKAMVDSKDSELAKTKDNYVAFLDVIAKETKVFDNNTSTMLAHAYMSLQVPTKAAAIFAKVQPPAGIEKKIVIPKKEDPDKKIVREKLEEDIARYWAIQIEYMRALRACKDKDSIKTAESLIKTLLEAPNARFQIQAMMEKNHLLEEQQRYSEACKGWQGIMKSTQGRLADKDVQKIYFTSYFQASRTLYQVGTLDPQIKKEARPKFITAAASMMVKLEYTKGQEGWQIVYPMFQEFLKDKEAEQFKKEYDRLKALQEKTSALTLPDLQIAANRETIGARDRIAEPRTQGGLCPQPKFNHESTKGRKDEMEQTWFLTGLT
jgi:hypothetical protein